MRANLRASRVSTNRAAPGPFQRDNYLSIDFQTRRMICRREAAPVRPSIVIEQLRGSEEEPLKFQLESFSPPSPQVTGRSSPVRMARRH
jgi:hypothetical protein